MTRPAILLLTALGWLLNQLRWARRTRPEPLPVPPAGSTTVRCADGTRLHAEVAGPPDSPVTMVFVHGFLARTLEWDMQWQHFGDQARIVRYDHRNHGRSTHARRPVTVETLSHDLAEVIAQAAPAGPVVLVGHSMGGMAVLKLALERPQLWQERVAGVALISSGAGHAIDGHRVENLLHRVARRHLLSLHLLALRLLAPTLERLRPRRTHVMRGVIARMLFGTQDVDPAALALTQNMLEGPPLSTLAAMQGSLLRHDALAALPQLRQVPVLVLTGQDDRLIRPEHSQRMAADIGPSAELVVVPGAGHVVNQTRPTEVNAALRRLLVRVEPRSEATTAVSPCRCGCHDAAAQACG